MAHAFEHFVADALETAPSFSVNDGVGLGLSIDVVLPGEGVCLNKKSETNALGARRPSVLQLVRDLAFPVDTALFGDITRLSDLFDKVALFVEDASPDSVVSAVIFAARQAGVHIPERFWGQWEPAITNWECTGVVDRPEESWPMLAAALAHSVLGDAEIAEGSSAALTHAWHRVTMFALEAMLAGYDPRYIPPTEAGPHLFAARAALDDELSRYERKIAAQEVHQLSLPIRGTDRRRLVDVLFTTEHEFSGAMKVFARNDQKNAPLGRGFSILVLERPKLKSVEPKYWMTISADPRANVHLLDLWRELEMLESAGWDKAGIERPKRTKHSRPLVGDYVPAAEEQHFHQQWYITPDGSLLGSPDRQTAVGVSSTHADRTPSSVLDTETVKRALFRVYDPFKDISVFPSEQRSVLTRLPDIPERFLDGGKRVLLAWWPKDDPLPHPTLRTANGGLFPTAIGAMAARSLGIPSDQAVERSPHVTDIELIPAGDTLAVVSNRGVFLLHSGQSHTSDIDAALQLIEEQAKVSNHLDKLQETLEAYTKCQAQDFISKKPEHSWLDIQRFCALRQAELVELRGNQDKPLQSNQAHLQPLKDELSRRWNTRARLAELVAEIGMLQQSARDAEELRVFRIGKLAAGFGLSIVVADALAGRVRQWVPLILQKISGHPPSNVLKANSELISFTAIFLISTLLFWFLSRSLRSPAGRSD